MSKNLMHIVTTGGSAERDFKPLRYNPVTHEQFKTEIAQFRLPPPRFWSILNTDEDDLANPDSRINKILSKHERADGDGLGAYLRAAIDDLFILEGSLAEFNYIYSVDMMQYPQGYEMVVKPEEFVILSALESLDLISMPSSIGRARNKVYLVHQTPRGVLTHQAIVKAYGN